MKTLLICPADLPAAAALSEEAPLANAPILGKALIEWWLDHFATQGVTEVRILATDRPEEIRKLVGDGSRWGMRVEVIPEHHELTPAQARVKYCPHSGRGWLASSDAVTRMDHLPGMAWHELFAKPANWFTAVQAWVPFAITPDRIGLHEMKPGVWVGLHAHIAPNAQLIAPCWIGDHVHIGAGAVIGPETVIENRAYVERGAEVAHSIVGPDTFVGQFTEIRNSLAFGSTLVNWQTNSTVMVPDPILLSLLEHSHRERKPVSWSSRVMALIFLLFSAPVMLPFAWLKSRWQNIRLLSPQIAVRPRGPVGQVPTQTYIYYEFNAFSGHLKRWPQLWNIVRGEFAWVGNRPLSPAQAGQLSNEFERMWLIAPIGLVSLADAEACNEAFGDESRLHASYYAAQANWRLDLSILTRMALVRFFGFGWGRNRPNPLSTGLLKQPI